MFQAFNWLDAAAGLGGLLHDGELWAATVQIEGQLAQTAIFHSEEDATEWVQELADAGRLVSGAVEQRVGSSWELVRTWR